MTLIDRAKNICTTPKTEWSVIADEPTQTGTLIGSYVVPLAALGAIAGFIGGSLIGYTLPFIGRYRVPVTAGLASLVLTVVVAVVGIFVVSLIINALAPSFGAQKDDSRALKVAVYSYTPAWVAGVFQIVPGLGVLVLLGALYGIYLMYLGLPRLMKCPEDKAPGYTAVVVVCTIVVMFGLTFVTSAIVGVGALGAAAARGASGGGLADVLAAGARESSAIGSAGAPATGSDTRPLSRLEQLARGLEESGRKMEAAEKSGDAQGQVAAAFEGLGTLFGGGRRVEPLELEQIKSFVPERFAGLPRTSSSSDRSGIGGLMVSRADATYSDGAGRSVTLAIADSGGVSGLMGLASWAGVQGEREDEYSIERTRRVDGRLVHERISKGGGDNELEIVVGERFMVSATGRGMDLNELRSAIAALDLGRLEALKDSGVQR